MRNPWVRGGVGMIAFALPALIVVPGLRLDQSSLRHDPTYAKLVPVMLWSSVILAAVVPAVLIMTSALSLPRRIGLTIAVWCLLALECWLAIYIVLLSGH